MYEADTSIEGLEALRSTVQKSLSTLEADLREAALMAAADGVRAEQESHPYRDWRIPGRSFPWHGALGLTDTAHAEQPRAGSLGRGLEAEMVWPADYAEYVIAKGYDFTPIAVQTAEYAVESYVERALANFRRSMGG